MERMFLNRIPRSLSFSLLFAFTAFFVFQAGAATVVGVNEPPGDDRDFTGTVGFTFDVDTAGLTVTELGAWDQDADGFANDVIVGLWDDLGNELARVTLSGTNGALDGETRFLALGSGNEVNLVQGDTYVLGARYVAGDTFKDDAPAGSVSSYFSSDFTFGQARFLSGMAFGYPTSATGDEEFFGANMRVVPEPATALLLVVGLGMLSFLRRCRSAGSGGLAFLHAGSR